LKNKDSVFLFLLVLLIAVGTTIRFVNLDSDPPLYFDGHSQSLSTDPYQYTYFARNKILFDEWELFDSDKWKVFEYSLVSGFSYLIFKLNGITRANANLTGLLLSLAAIFIFLFSLRKSIGLKGILIAAIFLIFNKAFFVYGRLPYLENGMILVISLLFFIFVYYRRSILGQISIGILIALSALTGKIFGFIIIVPVIVVLINESKKQSFKPLLAVILSSVVTSTIWILIIHGASLESFIGYYSSQTVGLYGIPDALKSPIAFFERLISFGSESRFYYHAPTLGIASFVGFLILIGKLPLEREKRSIILFLIFWLVASQLFFMVSNYRPLRYIYMLYFPMAGIIGYIFSKCAENFHFEFKLNIKKAIALFFVAWIFIYQVVINLFYLDFYESMYSTIVWISCLGTIIFILLEFKFSLIGNLTRNNFIRNSIIVCCVLSLVNFGWSYKNWHQQRSFNIKEAGEDIGAILGDNAILCGPMAPTLLLENNLKGIIYAVGISDLDPDFFRKNPVTHFLIDAEASGSIINKFPELKKAETVSEYWIRDSKILLVRISDCSGNLNAGNYKLTDFELGKRYVNVQQADSALYYLEKSLALFPQSKSIMKTLGETYPIFGDVEKGTELLKNTIALYSRDWSLRILLAAHYQQRARFENNRTYLALARQEYEKVIEINPYQWDEIESIVNRIDK